jgi:diguanylate cyclase (GGDEF)-like protein/hemerythrin-like metal-binding protein
MSMLKNPIQGLDDLAIRDLIERFPLPLALLDDAGVAVMLNDRFERTYGRDVLDSASLQALMREPMPGWQKVQVPGREHGEIEIKAQIFRVQGHPMLILDNATDPGSLLQLDQLQQQITELERRSFTDALTGARSRAHLDCVVASELNRSKRARHPVSLILIDIDHFKQLNDTYGHRAGDAVLCELVQVSGAAIRSTDTLFRWGGEKFVVLASSTDYGGAETLAEKIRSTVDQHRFAGVGSVKISLGVAEHIATERAKTWFDRVDRALHRAKKGGRNRVYVDARGSSDMWAAESGPSAIRLIWQEAYECGEPTIDRQHRELFELSNVLLETSSMSKSSPQELKEALENVLAHIAQHFADEEVLLARHGYKGLDAHRRAHARLLARAGQLQASVAAGKATLGNLVDFLANTVVAEHLFKQDRKFFPLFKKDDAPVEAFSP